MWFYVLMIVGVPIVLAMVSNAVESLGLSEAPEEATDTWVSDRKAA